MSSPSNRFFFIGHRGVGKSTLAKSLKPLLPEFKIFDLDDAIESSTGNTIAQIFETQGESSFRAAERASLDRALSSTPLSQPLLVVLGAGFEFEQFSFPTNSIFIWIRRQSDASGRLFLDRPNYSAATPDLEQYLERYAKREPLYLNCADLIWELPEGLERPLPLMSEVLKGHTLKSEEGTILTLLPWHIEKPQRLEFSVSKSLAEWIEIRTDLLDITTLQNKLNYFANKKILLSIRSDNYSPWLNTLKDVPFWVDVDPSFAHSTALKYNIKSAHTNEPPEQEHQKILLKWSPIISDFNQLKESLNWQQSDPQWNLLMPRFDSSFYGPMGSEWIRLYLKSRQTYNFVRNTPEGSYAGQPTEIKWQRVPNKPLGFNAVVGYPVWHSKSPEFHYRYSMSRDLGFLAVPLKDLDLKDGLTLLSDLGFQNLAVTAPHKKTLCHLSSKLQSSKLQSSKLAESLDSSNTVVFKRADTQLYNTDYFGLACVLKGVLAFGFKFDFDFFEYARQQLQAWGDLNSSSSADFDLFKKHLASVSEDFCVFGGGGLSSLLLDLLPHAQFIGARASADKGFKPPIKLGSNFIWAARPEASLPNWGSSFKGILDLNYVAHSNAIALAKTHKAPYLSGQYMFVAQGIAQQKLWG